MIISNQPKTQLNKIPKYRINLYTTQIFETVSTFNDTEVRGNGNKLGLMCYTDLSNLRAVLHQNILSVPTLVLRIYFSKFL